MKINVKKQPGGVLSPMSDIDAEALNGFKTGETYESVIKRSRNPAFHRKTFAFLNFCFQHWQGDREFASESKQFDVFRSHLTVLAGFYDQLYNINGDLRIEAKSLSYGSMSAEDFAEFYSAVIQAAMKHVFKTADEQTFNKLMSFF
jgi:hypothetical protein